MPAATPVPDDDQLTVKACKTGFRVMRGRGPNRPFIFVRTTELLNLCNHLIDTYERNHHD